MVKIKEYRITRRGPGVAVTLPQVWVRDNDLHIGDVLCIYRDESDALIIRPLARPNRDDTMIAAGRTQIDPSLVQEATR